MDITHSAKDIFVERLVDQMNERGLTATTLSIASNIPRTTISNWLHHTRTPQIDSLCVLAEYFGVTTDYLLGRED